MKGLKRLTGSAVCNGLEDRAGGAARRVNRRSAL